MESLANRKQHSPKGGSEKRQGYQSTKNTSRKQAKTSQKLTGPESKQKSRTKVPKKMIKKTVKVKNQAEKQVKIPEDLQAE